MKSIIIPIIGVIAIISIWIGGTIIHANNFSSRDLNYEHYCDSIYENDVDYYLDVLVETDEFQNYLEQHGQWWED